MNEVRDRVGSLVRWVLLALLLVSTVLPPDVLGPLGPLLVGELPVVIALLHFASWTRWSTALLGLAIMVSIAYLSEFIGTQTGVVFGDYAYSPTAIGPLVGEVPILLPLAYFSMGYGAYVVTRLIMGNVNRRLGGVELVLTSLLAGIIMTLIDIVSDPIASTLLGKWTWEGGGAYFGVPVHNFYGWLGTTFAFLIVVSLLLNRRANVSLIARPRSRGFFAQAIVLYASYAIGVIVNPLLGRDGDIYDSMSMLAAFTAALPVLLATWLTWQAGPRSVRPGNPE